MSKYAGINFLVRGQARKPRRKASNAGDAEHLIQEARERDGSANPMSDAEYSKRMNDLCRDTPGDKGPELLKARLKDMHYREERRI